jgi:hypothetical protein
VVGRGFPQIDDIAHGRTLSLRADAVRGLYIVVEKTGSPLRRRNETVFFVIFAIKAPPQLALCDSLPDKPA